jgi:hypothetical protein
VQTAYEGALGGSALDGSVVAVRDDWNNAYDGKRVSRWDGIWVEEAAVATEDSEGKDRMKPMVIVGVVCIVLGLAALAYQGITYTTREKVFDVGPVQVTAEKQHAIWLPPVLGVVAVGAGVVLVVVGARRS